MSVPPWPPNIEGSAFCTFGFQQYSETWNFEKCNYRFQRPHPDPVKRSSPPTKRASIRKHRRRHATVITSLRSPLTECEQTKLVVMTECGMIVSGHCTEKRSDGGSATTATQQCGMLDSNCGFLIEFLIHEARYVYLHKV